MMDELIFNNHLSIMEARAMKPLQIIYWYNRAKAREKRLAAQE